MSSKNKQVPTVILDEVHKSGVQVVRYSKVDKDHFVKSPHRDQDYLFVYVNKGYLMLFVDFKEVIISEKSIYFILPGQIHQHIDSDIDVFVIAADAALVKDVFKNVLEDSCFTQLPLQITTSKAIYMETSISLLADFLKDASTTTYKQHVKQGLIDSVVGIIAEEYSHIGVLKNAKDSRSTYITKEFRNLLFKKYKELKRPSEYAGALHISTPYLNEAVKLTSGSTASYWIQYMIIIEAKRLLFYTDKNIKEIASEVGYSDHAYFTRIFTKVEKLSPQAFRRKYR